ncbi:RPA2 [Bugula neritina]|uniref:RPA2 n=1 Tax=Bugula neritina TaxID=10212 RepID=A0A7J7JY23_BUGNE|nr:RPA2 [Bugula neritina]
MAWNDQGGGFETSPSVGASPSVARERGHEEKNGMKPMCIKAIHRALVDDQFVCVDGSGLQQDEDATQPQPISQGEYVRVFGTVKSFQGSANIVINRIMSMNDPNEITMHLLEMSHTYLKMKQAGEGDASQVDTSAGIPEQVRTVIQGNKSMTGLSVTEIKAALPHVTADEITKAINYLSGEGFIFSTIDDDHFRATEDA